MPKSFLIKRKLTEHDEGETLLESYIQQVKSQHETTGKFKSFQYLIIQFRKIHFKNKSVLYFSSSIIFFYSNFLRLPYIGIGIIVLDRRIEC